MWENISVSALYPVDIGRCMKSCLDVGTVEVQRRNLSLRKRPLDGIMLGSSIENPGGVTYGKPSTSHRIGHMSKIWYILKAGFTSNAAL